MEGYNTIEVGFDFFVDIVLTLLCFLVCAPLHTNAALPPASSVQMNNTAVLIFLVVAWDRLHYLRP